MNLFRFESRKSQALGFVAKSVLAILLSCSFLVSFSQEAPSGALSGRVQDADYGGSVLNAKVMILENQKSVKANVDGRYFIDALPEGIYTLVVTASLYKTSRIESVKIGSGESKKLDVPLFNDSSEVFELEAFSVKATVLEESDVGLISKRQKASAISDSMGAESFGRLGLGNAAEALSKVTGTSIQDGKYVIVRGLSDRYNTTTMNGSTIPSADPNRKSVQLDQFPTDLLGVVETTKTFTPDKSGDFTGGAIDIRTKSFPNQFFYNVSYGIGYNENTTGDSFLSYPGGGDDWLGKDHGTRSIPEHLLQYENLSTLSNEDQSGILDEFSSVVSPVDSGDAPLNQRFSFAFGDSILLSGDGKNDWAIPRV